MIMKALHKLHAAKRLSQWRKVVFEVFVCLFVCLVVCLQFHLLPLNLNHHNPSLSREMFVVWNLRLQTNTSHGPSFRPHCWQKFVAIPRRINAHGLSTYFVFVSDSMELSLIMVSLTSRMLLIHTMTSVASFIEKWLQSCIENCTIDLKGIHISLTHWRSCPRKYVFLMYITRYHKLTMEEDVGMTLKLAYNYSYNYCNVFDTVICVA